MSIAKNSLTLAEPVQNTEKLLSIHCIWILETDNSFSLCCPNISLYLLSKDYLSTTWFVGRNMGNDCLMTPPAAEYYYPGTDGKIGFLVLKSFQRWSFCLEVIKTQTCLHVHVRTSIGTADVCMCAYCGMYAPCIGVLAAMNYEKKVRKSKLGLGLFTTYSV